MPAATAVPPATGTPPADPAAQSGSAIPPSGKGEIHVIPQPVEATPPPKPGSAKERLFQDLRKRAKPAEDATPPADDSIKNKPAGATAATGTPPAGAQPPEAGAKPPEGKPGETTKAGEPKAGEDKKVNPWKLVDTYKEKTAKLEKELADAKAATVPEADRKQYLDRIEKSEARAKELENEIRYVNYSKSEEFQKKYQQPYEQAWQRAISELSEVTITDAAGNQRAVKGDDILELVNLPLGKAREVANQVFGDFADDVMQHRKEIRTLFDSQQQALKEARESGEAREKERRELFQKTASEIQKFVADTWTSVNDSALKDERYGKFFTPVEGNAEINQRLEKGFALVDRAWAENPQDPRLKPEERAAIIKRHAAVRNRAAAFGRLVYELGQEREAHEATKKELEQYKGSSPPMGGGKTETTTTQPSSAKEAVFQGLRKYAKNV